MKKLFSIVLGLALTLTVFVAPTYGDAAKCDSVCQTKRLLFSNGVVIDYVDVDCDGKADMGVMSMRGQIGLFTLDGLEALVKRAEKEGYTHREVPSPAPCDKDKPVGDPARFDKPNACNTDLFAPVYSTNKKVS